MPRPVVRIGAGDGGGGDRSRRRGASQAGEEGFGVGAVDGRQCARIDSGVQADHPDLADWLMEQGIESVSLNPDTVVDTWLRLARIKAS